MSRLNIKPARILRQSAFALGLSMLASSQPLAETACTRLFDRLDEIEQQAGGEDVAAELEDARALYEDMSCPEVPTGEGCPQLASRINRLQTSGAGQGNLGREKQRLMSALTRAGCFRDRPGGREDGAPGAWDPSEDADNPELFEQLQREGGREEDAWTDTPPQQRQDGGEGAGGMSPAVAGGRYTTLCVRSCDGFYFPISNSAHPGVFAQDEAACKATCPNQDVSLYYSRPGADKEQALSASGNEPYTSLAKALHYRTKYEKSCQCAPAQQAADPQAVDAVQDRLKTPSAQANDKPQEIDETEAAPAEEDAEIIRSAPSSPRSSVQQNSSGPNGLRGVSPEQR